MKVYVEIDIEHLSGPPQPTDRVVDTIASRFEDKVFYSGLTSRYKITRLRYRATNYHEDEIRSAVEASRPAGTSPDQPGTPPT